MLPLTANHYEHGGEVTAILSAQGLNISTFGAATSSKEADVVRDVAATHAFIVRACNSHAALAEALGHCLVVLKYMASNGKPIDPRTIAEAEQALSKAAPVQEMAEWNDLYHAHKLMADHHARSALSLARQEGGAQ